MLRDLFFNIWYDDMGSGWLLLVIVLFFLCIAFLVFTFARIKARNAKICKKHFICLGLALLALYQIIPVSIDFYANAMSPFDIEKAIKFEKVAIKTSIIPWQKGGYYCKLATLHLLNKEHKKMFESYDSAYKYLKSYKYPCWGISFLSYFTNRDYDAAIEIAKSWSDRSRIGTNPQFGIISQCYLMKGDIKNAELFIDKALQQIQTFKYNAIKAYILKEKGNTKEALEYYKKAKELCKNENQKDVVEKIYKNFVEYENNEIDKLQKKQGLK